MGVGRGVLSRTPEGDVCRAGAIYVAWRMCREVVKDKAAMMDLLHILDLLGNLNETKTPLFE